MTRTKNGARVLYMHARTDKWIHTQTWRRIWWNSAQMPITKWKHYNWISAIWCSTRIFSLILMIWGYTATVIAFDTFIFWETEQIVSISLEKKNKIKCRWTHIQTRVGERKLETKTRKNRQTWAYKMDHK